MFTLLDHLPSASLIIVAILASLIGLGIALTLTGLVMRGCLILVNLCGWSLARLWGWLRGRPPGSHGTAHWATAAELTATRLLAPGTIPIGTWHGQTLYEPFGGHLALIGPPRSGKSYGLAAPAMAQFTGSVIS